MSGLCGWLGGSVSGGDAKGVIAAMAGGLYDFPGSQAQSCEGGGFGLAVKGHETSISVFEDESIAVAIEGYPRWTDADLDTLATREGHAAALASAYKRLGRNALQQIMGAWSLAILDRAKETALLAIDRLGIRPLCYAPAPSGRGIVFGTTTDSVTAHPDIQASLSHQAIFDYMFFTRSPAPGTIFQEVTKLLPGQCIWFEKGKAEASAYWRVDYSDDPRSQDELAEELMAVLRRAMKRAVAGCDFKATGSFLSGGIDSSTVTGLLAEQSDRVSRSFGVGFDSVEHNEMGYARITAKHYGVELQEYYVTPADIVDFIPKIADIYDEPYGNSSAVAAYYCTKMAREQGIDLLLAGDGGDELFAGNERYADQKIFEAYNYIPGWLRGGLLEPIVMNLPAGDKVMPLRKARSYIRRAKVPLPDRLESYNFYNDMALSDCFLPDTAEAIDRQNPYALLRMHYHDSGAESSLDSMLYLDVRTTLADDDLRKVEQTAALAGVDVRYPLLDEEVLSFSAKIPPAMKLEGRKLRSFFKYAVRDFLPPETLTKSKHGFGLPFGLWLKTDPGMQALAYDSLASLKKRDIFQPGFLDSAIETHRSGHSSFHGELIWVLMLLELWFQKHRDRSRVASAA